MTNADKIRSMTDRELADFLYFAAHNVIFEVKADVYDYGLYDKMSDLSEYFISEYEKWLQSEAGSEGK